MISTANFNISVFINLPHLLDVDVDPTCSAIIDKENNL